MTPPDLPVAVKTYGFMSGEHKEVGCPEEESSSSSRRLDLAGVSSRSRRVVGRFCYHVRVRIGVIFK